MKESFIPLKILFPVAGMVDLIAYWTIKADMDYYHNISAINKDSNGMALGAAGTLLTLYLGYSLLQKISNR